MKLFLTMTFVAIMSGCVQTNSVPQQTVQYTDDVLAEDEYLSDCEEYEMPECYEIH
jgi:hypothetical protein